MLCGSRLYATLDQVGKQVKCPDCLTRVLVKPPKEPPKPAPVYDDKGGDFQLGDAIELHKSAYLPEEDIRPDGVDTNVDTADEVTAAGPISTDHGARAVGQTSEDDFFSEDQTASPAPVSGQSPPQSVPQHRDGAPPSEERTTSAPKNGASPAPAASKRAQSAPAKTHQEFGIECMVCGTRMYAMLDQVGKKVKCPDCHSKVLVKPPTKPPEAAPVYESDDDDFKLSEPVERADATYLPQPDLRPDRDVESTGTGNADGMAKPKMPRERLTVIAMRDDTLDTLSKAQAELDEEDRARPKMPDQPFKTGIISFLFDAAALLRLVLLTLAGHTTLASLVGAFSMADSGPVQQFIAIILFGITAVLGLVFLFSASGCCAAIVQETANGYDKMEQWPGFNLGDWMMDALYIINSLFASGALGSLPCMLVASPEITMVAGAVTGITLFPVFLLSAMDQGSPLGFVSREIWQSVRTASQLWLKFYLLSVVFAVVGLLATYFLARSMAATGGFVIGAFFSAILVATAMIYCRLLGRLAWRLSERKAQDDGGAGAKNKTLRNGSGSQPPRDADPPVPSEKRRPTPAKKPSPSLPPPSGAGKEAIPMVQCPHCKVTFKAHDAGILGKEVPCPMCHKPFVAKPIR